MFVLSTQYRKDVPIAIQDVDLEKRMPQRQMRMS